MKTVHFVMQSKGGVGKSFCALMLSQYLINKGINPVIADTDPSNQSLSSFRKLKACYLNLLNDEDNVEIGCFDKVCEFLDATEEGSSVVIDSGSSTFVQLFNFLSKLDVTTMWKDQNFHVIIHVPIACADMRKDCTLTLENMIQNFKEVDFVAWINNYPERVFKNDESIDTWLKNIKKNEAIKLVIDLPKLETSTEGKTLRECLNGNYIFSEVEREDFNGLFFGRSLITLDRWRIKKIKEKIFNSLSPLDNLI